MSILLEARKAKILRILVNEYVETCEPVGSRRIADVCGLEVRSATIRNEMAELSDMGLLTQPHRSAGRIPSELGYRVFVDSLMERCSIDPGAGRLITEALRQKSEIEILITAACRVLSELCGYVACCCYPSMKNSYINHISLTAYGTGRILLVCAASNAYIMHRIIDMDIRKAMFSLETAANYLNQHFKGRELRDITADTAEAGVFAGLTEEFLETIKNEGRAADEKKYYYDGIGRLLHLPEFQDVEKLERVISVLEDNRLMSRLISFHETPGKSIRIGSEIGIHALSDCSAVGMVYRIHGNPSGSIAVIGPTRMDYSHSLAALELVSEHLEIMLDSLLG